MLPNWDLPKQSKVAHSVGVEKYRTCKVAHQEPAGAYLRVLKSNTKVSFVTLNFPALRPPWMIHLSATTAAQLCSLNGGG